MLSMLFLNPFALELTNLPELKDNGVSCKLEEKKEKNFTILNSLLAVSVYLVGVNYLTHAAMI